MDKKIHFWEFCWHWEKKNLSPHHTWWCTKGETGDCLPLPSGNLIGEGSQNSGKYAQKMGSTWFKYLHFFLFISNSMNLAFLLLLTRKILSYVTAISTRYIRYSNYLSYTVSQKSTGQEITHLYIYIYSAHLLLLLFVVIFGGEYRNDYFWELSMRGKKIYS